MKYLTILTISILLSIWSFGQTRPPIVTNEIQTQNFDWENNLIDRDLMVYYRMIGDSCFQISPLQEVPVWSERFCFEQKQYVYWAEGDLWLCDGCTVIYNENSVLIRRDPECGNCWQYSNDGGATWIDLWCESRLDRILKVAPSSLNILKLGNYIEWTGEDSLRAGIEYIGFKRDSTNEGNWLHFVNDSVKWEALPEDSVFYYNKWYNLPDTLPEIEQKDSIYFANIETWATDQDTVNLFWRPDENGIWFYDNIGINDNSISNYPLYVKRNLNRNSIFADGQVKIESIYADTLLNIKSTSWGMPILIESDYSPAINVHSYNNSAIKASTHYGEHTISATGGGYDKSTIYAETGFYAAIEGRALDGFSAYSAKFSGGYGVVIDQGLQTDSITIGSGSTISRSGTMMSYDLWYGTQAEWNANTPKNGIYPQASTTFWTIKD